MWYGKSTQSARAILCVGDPPGFKQSINCAYIYPLAGKMLARLSGSPRIVIYPDGYHLLLRDLSAEVVLADISAWITGTDGKLPSGYSGEWQLFFEQ